MARNIENCEFLANNFIAFGDNIENIMRLLYNDIDIAIRKMAFIELPLALEKKHIAKYKRVLRNARQAARMVKQFTPSEILEDEDPRQRAFSRDSP